MGRAGDIIHAHTRGQGQIGGTRGASPSKRGADREIVHGRVDQNHLWRDFAACLNFGDDFADCQKTIVHAGEFRIGKVGHAIATRSRPNTRAQDRQKPRAGDQYVHAVKDRSSIRRVEAAQEKRFQEPSVLRLAGAQYPVDFPGERVRRAGGIGVGVRQEQGGVADDGETDALDKTFLALRIGGGRQIRALAEFPLNFRDGIAMVVKKSGAGLRAADW